jgi:hypothetical protein
MPSARKSLDLEVMEPALSHQVEAAGLRDQGLVVASRDDHRSDLERSRTTRRRRIYKGV